MTENTQISILEEEIKEFIKRLKQKEIYFFDVSEEYRLHPIIVEIERDLGIRKSDKRGYDIIHHIFFVEEIVLARNGSGEVVEELVKNSFSDFASYYQFLRGNIYENACYFQYCFSQMEQDIYDIDLSKINTTAFIDITVKDFTIGLSDKELQDYKKLEKEKSLRKKWIAKFNACNTYEDLKKVVKNFNKSKFSKEELVFFFFNFIFANKDKAFDIIMQYVSSGAYPSYRIERELCSIYDPQKVLASYNYTCGAISTNNRHKRKFREYVKQLENEEVTFDEYSYFDKDTHFFCYQVNGYIDGRNGGCPVVQIFRYFEMFQELVEFLENDLSYCDLSEAILPDIDFSVYKTSEYTKLPIQDPKDLTYVIYKGYDRKKDIFVVQQSWLNSNGQVIKKYENCFFYFCDFIYFLENDLSNADLLFCDGLDYIQDFSNINFTNARVKSSILEKIRMKYSLSVMNSERIEHFPFVVKNEGETSFILTSKREDNDKEEIMKDHKVYYISDLHLLHRLKHADTKSKEDDFYVIQKIIDNLLDEISFLDCLLKKNIILIGGDTSSNFEIFCLFVSLLRASIDERRLDIYVVFLLGNHELWEFPDFSFEEIVNRYETLLNKHKMYLLQNNIIYKNDENQIQEISTEELISISGNALQERLLTARVILFGGLAFSGYNQEFNANSGIYRDTIKREQEICESEKFEKLYHIVCNNLSNKRVIIFTHMPQKDWCSLDEQQLGFVYVNGHTHRNYFYDDGDYRIYADNQIGYYHENPYLKYFYLEDDYDCFLEYGDGIYKITKEQYIDFYRGKNIEMQFTREIETLYMLKKNGYYCFIHENWRRQLTILNGGGLKKLDVNDINYYYDKMDKVIESIKNPLDKFTMIQEKIANEIKAIGGLGKIHGAIVDIDFCNHIYVNPYDLTITGYYALNMIYKKVFSSVPELLKINCPSLYHNYLKRLIEKGESHFRIESNRKEELDMTTDIYLDTDIYKASREIKKMQKLSSNILSIWCEPIQKRIE